MVYLKLKVLSQDRSLPLHLPHKSGWWDFFPHLLKSPNWPLGTAPQSSERFSLLLLLSHVQLIETPWTAACQVSLSFTISQSLLKLISIESVIPFNHLILCHPFLLLPSIFPSIRVFSNVSVLCIRCPKYWSFNFSISPSNEYSGLISFRMDRLALLAVQGTLRVFSNTTLQKHQFFGAQPSLWSNTHIHT